MGVGNEKFEACGEQVKALGIPGGFSDLKQSQGVEGIQPVLVSKSSGQDPESRRPLFLQPVQVNDTLGRFLFLLQNFLSYIQSSKHECEGVVGETEEKTQVLSRKLGIDRAQRKKGLLGNYPKISIGRKYSKQYQN